MQYVMDYLKNGTYITHEKSTFWAVIRKIVYGHFDRKLGKNIYMYLLLKPCKVTNEIYINAFTYFINNITFYNVILLFIADYTVLGKY